LTELKVNLVTDGPSVEWHRFDLGNSLN